jgi:hypothetical protein
MPHNTFLKINFYSFIYFLNVLCYRFLRNILDFNKSLVVCFEKCVSGGGHI